MTREQLDAARRQAWRYGRQAGDWYIRVRDADEHGVWPEGFFMGKIIVDAASRFLDVLAGFIGYDSFEMARVRDAYHDGVDGVDLR